MLTFLVPPVAVSAIFAGLLTKVGVYALIRVFTLLFTQEVSYTHTLILAVAGLTMVTGVLGAMAQHEFRRILSFHIVSQIGYMLMGLGLFTVAGLASSIFYIMHHIIVKTNLFLISGVVNHFRGTYQLKELGGLYRAYPGLAVLFLIPALSLAGVPPLSGFFAKLGLLQAGLATGQYAIVATALGVSLLTLISMTKIWAEAFWKPATATSVDPPAAGTGTPQDLSKPDPPKQDPPKGRLALFVPVVVLAVLTLTIGLVAEPFVGLAIQAAHQLMNPSGYIEAVLGGRP